MNWYIEDNSMYCFEGIGFDPVKDGKTVLIKQIWITDYSRRKGIKYGLKEREIYIIISNKIKAFEDKNNLERDDYIKANWISFLNYAIFRTYPEDLMINYGEATIDEPQWESIADIREELGAQIEKLIPISPYS